MAVFAGVLILATVSSLFSILSIFTDDLDDDVPFEKQEPMQESVFPGLKRDSIPAATPTSENETPTSYFELSKETKDSSYFPDKDPLCQEENHIQENPIEEPKLDLPIGDSPVAAEKIDINKKEEVKKDPPPPLTPPKTKRTVHPDIVARAFIDTTLVVIPAEAFKKLVEKFPFAGSITFS
jgi:lysophospholipid hydrolase